MIKILTKKFLTGILVSLSLNNAYAQTQPAPETIQGVGYVEPVGQVLRLNFKHPGIIGETLVTIGQEVKKGTVLARQASSEDQAMLAAERTAVDLARAELKQLLAGVNPARIHAQESIINAKKATSDYAKFQEQRMNKLLEKNVVSAANKDLAVSEALRSEADVKATEAELRHLRDYVRPVDQAVAEAQVQVAEAKLNLQKARLDETELRAPSDGMVLEVLRQTGDTTDSSEPVLLFADVSHLQVRAELDETYALMLRVGQRATLSGRGLETKAIEGVVTHVKPIMGKKTVFARTATERKDVDVRQVFVQLPEGVDLPIGLETDVVIRVGGQ
jgi:HlyD family secretion protein